MQTTNAIMNRFSDFVFSILTLPQLLSKAGDQNTLNETGDAFHGFIKYTNRPFHLSLVRDQRKSSTCLEGDRIEQRYVKAVEKLKVTKLRELKVADFSKIGYMFRLIM